MTANDAIKKIKIMLGIEKMQEQKSLADGTIVEANPAFEVGAQLSVVGEDGAMVPAPEGQHTLEDGVVVKVDAAGVITEIMEAEPVEAAKEEEKMEEIKEEVKVEEEMEVEPMVVAEVTQEIVSEIVEAIAPMVQDIVAMKEEIVEMKKQFAKFSAEPAAKPVKNNFNEVSTSVDKRLAVLAELRKQNKTKQTK
jgi:hypothetical protein